MRRRVMLVSVWAVGAVVCIALATFGVSLARATLTTPAVSPISHHDVEQQLAAATPAGTAPVDIDGGTSLASIDDQGSTDEPGHDRSGGPSGRADDDSAASGGDDGGASGGTSGRSPGGPSSGSGSAGGDGSGAGSSGSGQGSTDGGGHGPGGEGEGGHDGGASGQGGPGSPSPSPTTAAPAATSQSFSMVGGTVVVYCAGTTATASASPAAGFGIDTNDAGPAATIDVRFRRDDPSHRSELKASCSGGVPTVIDQRED